MLNQVTLVGNLGQDPDVGETAGNKRYARLSIATSESWRDKSTGEKREKTEWHRVVVWGDGLAGMLKQYAKKGTKLLVQGKLATREWEKDGVKRYATEIVVQGGDGQVKLLGSSASGSGGVPAPDDPPDGRPGREVDDQIPF